jgi:uncharacterized membrane protein
LAAKSIFDLPHLRFQNFNSKEASMAQAVFCLIETRGQAEEIVDELKSAGFRKDQISVLLPDKSDTKEFAKKKHTKAPEGAATGAATGGVVGGVLGWLAGIGSLTIPGLGPFIAAGPLAAALAGAGAGAAVGGLTGALIGLGIPEAEAKEYEKKIKQGNALVSAHSNDPEQCERAEEIFERLGARDVSYIQESDVPYREKHKERHV